MTILEESDSECKLGENDDIFSEYEKEIGDTTLADHVADLFAIAPAESCSDLFAPTEKKVAGNLQELQTSFQ